ncbi:MAG: VIT1/CCC1 transporter family protein [Chloroflexi bacterium]|nr:VIT1/CCC1 transporter family protein [Chloroflexota bacterium]
MDDLEQEREQALRALRQMQQAQAVTARGGSLRAAVFGVNDGLVSNLSLVVGVAAAEPGQGIVLLAGVAGLVAGAFSMAAGEYISMRVQREVFEHALARERAELETVPDLERQEIEVIFRAKGIPREDASRLADMLIAEPQLALDLMAREELQINPDDLGSPVGASASSFLAFAGGAVIPVLPFLGWSGWSALGISLGLSGLGLFAVGVLTARLSGRNPFFGGARMLLIGAVAAAVTYLVGRLVGVGLA